MPVLKFLHFLLSCFFSLYHRFSGVTEEDLQDVEIKLKDVHRKLLKKFGTDTILIGHSLESDLRALKVYFWRLNILFIFKARMTHNGKDLKKFQQVC